jgi:protein-S-isoprenylcysteine O-methyltransferase Ste14
MNKTPIAPMIVSTIVLLGFVMFSFLAMKPETAGVKDSVVLFLLGAWSTLAAAVVAYWVGSSAGSAKKDDVIQTMTTTAGTTAATAGTIADTASAVEKKS